VILTDEAFPQRNLICGWRIAHIKNLFARAHIALRMAVTVKTPLHGERLGLPRERHLIDTAVTSRTANAFMNVNTVVEVYILRQIVYARPLDGFTRSIAFAHGFKRRTDGPQLLVAIHADFRGGNVGVG